MDKISQLQGFDIRMDKHFELQGFDIRMDKTSLITTRI
jgi:hypothetical protein